MKGWWVGVLWTWNGNSNDDDEVDDESDGNEGDDYVENDDNDNNEDDDLDNIEYESSDVIYGTEGISIIEVKHKGETKWFEAEETSSIVLFITGS